MEAGASSCVVIVVNYLFSNRFSRCRVVGIVCKNLAASVYKKLAALVIELL